MNMLRKLTENLRQKGLTATVKKVWKHYVFSHQELLWMERDLVSPIAVSYTHLTLPTICSV